MTRTYRAEVELIFKNSSGGFKRQPKKAKYLFSLSFPFFPLSFSFFLLFPFLLLPFSFPLRLEVEPLKSSYGAWEAL